MPSSVVTAINYDADTSTLRICYISGAVYDYKDVPRNVYTAMRSSGSKGVFLNRKIKNKYTYDRIK